MRIFFNELGEFPRSLEFAVIPEGDILHFINTSDFIYPNDLYHKFKASDTRDLVSVACFPSCISWW